MCYHGSKNYTIADLDEYYGLDGKKDFEAWEPYFHENGFDHNLCPVVVNNNGIGYGNMSWGLIPWYEKPEQIPIIRNQTLNCISEKMFDKPSFRDCLKEGNRGSLVCRTFPR